MTMNSARPGLSRRGPIKGSVTAAAGLLVSAKVTAEPRKLDKDEVRQRILRQLGPDGAARAELQAVEELVYRPAGMRQTAHLTLSDFGDDVARGYTAGCFARPPSQCTQGTPREARGGYRGTPAGGCYSTLGDLLRFSAALRAGRLVRPDTLRLMTSRHVEVASRGLPMDGYGYGFGLLNINGQESLGHNGGTPGAACQLDLIQQSSLTIVVLTNTDGAQRPVSSLLRRALFRDETFQKG